MWPCGLVGWQGAWPGRKVSFLGHPGSSPSSPCTGLLWAWGLSNVYLKTAAPSVCLGCGHRALLVCGFPLSGRNTGSVFWGQAPLVSLCGALPWKGHKGGVCVPVPETGGQLSLQMRPILSAAAATAACLFKGGLAHPGWVQVSTGPGPAQEPPLGLGAPAGVFPHPPSHGGEPRGFWGNF